MPSLAQFRWTERLNVGGVVDAYTDRPRSPQGTSSGLAFSELDFMSALAAAGTASAKLPLLREASGLTGRTRHRRRTNP